jgi:hypothetical protein
LNSLTAAEKLIMMSTGGSGDSVSKWVKSKDGIGISTGQVSAFNEAIGKNDYGTAKALLQLMARSHAMATLHASGGTNAGNITSMRAALSRSQTVAAVRESISRGDGDANRMLDTVAAHNAVATLTQRATPPQQGFLFARASPSDPQRDAAAELRVAAAELEAINQAQRDRVAAERAEADRLRAAAAYNQDLAVPGAEAPAEWYIEAGQSQIRDPASATQQKTNAGVVAVLVGIPIVASLFL